MDDKNRFISNNWIDAYIDTVLLFQEIRILGVVKGS